MNEKRKVNEGQNKQGKDEGAAAPEEPYLSPTRLAKESPRHDSTNHQVNIPRVRDVQGASVASRAGKRHRTEGKPEAARPEWWLERSDSPNDGTRPKKY